MHRKHRWPDYQVSFFANDALRTFEITTTLFEAVRRPRGYELCLSICLLNWLYPSIILDFTRCSRSKSRETGVATLSLYTIKQYINFMFFNVIIKQYPFLRQAHF